MRVMSTDYRTYAVVMTCLMGGTGAGDSLTCHIATDTVLVMSRTRTITDSYLDDILEDISGSCFRGDDLEWISQGQYQFYCV